MEGGAGAASSTRSRGAASTAGATPVNIKKLVNEIFATKGLPQVKNFQKEFADGSKLISFKTVLSPLPRALQHFI